MSTLDQLRVVRADRDAADAALTSLIVKAVGDGHPIRQVAIAAGVTRTTVYRILKGAPN